MTPTKNVVFAGLKPGASTPMRKNFLFPKRNATKFEVSLNDLMVTEVSPTFCK